MDRKLSFLLSIFLTLTAVSFLTVAVPPMGLSTVLGVSVLSSSVLGSSVLGSSVLGSSVLASTTIVEAYGLAITASQVWLSLAAIGLLVYLELTDPAYGGLKNILVELRKSWLPITGLLVMLFFIIVAIKIWGILAV